MASFVGIRRMQSARRPVVNAIVNVVPRKETGSANLDSLLSASRVAFASRGRPRSAEERIYALSDLEKAIYARRMDIAAAVSADFNGRAFEETLAVEVFSLLDEIRHTRKQLKRWMRPRTASTNWLFRPSRSRVIYQPLGVVGVMGAFNYPVFLTLSPMVGALAAGNHVIAKPSELTPRSAELMSEIISSVFKPDYVAVVTGDSETSKAFARLPFDHLLFTGSTRVGREIMRQAADHLTPVTLELGGKSPAIVGRDYPLQKAVEEICYAKLLNAGQTCVAPDHVWVPEEFRDEFIQLAHKTISAYYPRLVDNPDYTRLISSREHQRLEGWREEALRKGAKVDIINPAKENCDSQNRVFAPTLVWECPEDLALMRQEIFGPILPVLSYRSLDDVIARTNNGPRPLALYYFDNNRRAVEEVLERTLSGGVTINGCIYHIAQHGLPFGGVGDSGMGHYHGFDGFETFSKKKAVFQASSLMTTSMLRPPFGKAIQWIIGILLSGRIRREILPEKTLRKF
jgi:acyl-CoA reductase-like NAD-dependent aldehyde dehydrogenase